MRPDAVKDVQIPNAPDTQAQYHGVRFTTQTAGAPMAAAYSHVIFDLDGTILNTLAVSYTHLTLPTN